MGDHILLLTGKFAEKSLRRLMDSIAPRDFTFEILNIGVSVAALMTVDMIMRRLSDARGASRILLPGLCVGDLDAAATKFGVPVQRGPVDLKDLPAHFGTGGRPPDLSRHDMQIFAEIVDAPNISVEQILKRAEAYKRDGADVIDVGSLPSTPFPHLEEAVRALREAGHQVSVDSMEPEELRRGGQAGAHYLLSLKESTLYLTDEVDSVPVLIPESPGDMDSLYRAIDELAARGRRFIADSILDPIHFGFTDSLLRYAALRRARPDAGILMGTGNLTELTDADSAGVTAVLMGIVSELHITNVLIVQVSPHCRRAVRETDAARRLMFAARDEGSLPSGLGGALLCLHDRKPFPNSPAEIAETAAMVADDNFRVEAGPDGVHVYNRQGHHVAGDPFALYPHLGVEDDGGHAFYLGVETAKAHIAWQLGKRYVQDEPLAWGCAVDRPADDPLRHKAAGTTLTRRRRDPERP